MVDVRIIRLILELREYGISDSKVLSAIEKIPRENFIPKAFKLFFVLIRKENVK